MFSVLVSIIVLCVGVVLVKDGSAGLIGFIRNLFNKD